MSNSRTNGNHLRLVTDVAEAEAEQDELVGKDLTNKYTVRRRLGRGGMGTVYLAEHHTLKTEVAIKVLNPDMGKVAAERFGYEARTAAQIKSPHIVRVTDFFQDEAGNYCLVMEYVEGSTLAEIVEREGPLPVERVLGIVQQAGWALAKAHEVGIVHRDIKPENVMVTDVGGSEFVKIMDFGIAAVVDEEQRKRLDRRKMTLELSGIIGTPEYMAPEQAAGDPPDARTDIYALAVVTYYLLTGSVPIESDSIADLLSKIIHQPPRPIGERIPALAPLWLPLSKALAKDRNDRFAGVQAFIDALLEAAGMPTRPSRVSGQHQALAMAHAPTLDATGARRAAIDSSAPTRSAPPVAGRRPPRRQPWGWPLVAGLGGLLFASIAIAYAITLRGGTQAEPALEEPAAETLPTVEADPDPEPPPRVERVVAPRPERSAPRVERREPERAVEARPEPRPASPPPRAETAAGLSEDDASLLRRVCVERFHRALCGAAVADHCPACGEEQPPQCRLARARAGRTCPGGR